MNILAADQEALSTRFAKSGGDKFAGVACRPGRLGSPLIEGAIGHPECRIVETCAGGDHVVHLGEVDDGAAPGGTPLLFFEGTYRLLAGD